MSKERLEEIKKHRNEADNCIDEYEFEKINFYNLHVDWLIEQAERAQELENVNRVLQKANEGLERDKERLREWVDEIEAENERLRKQNIELFESNRHYLAENKWLKRRRLND